MLNQTMMNETGKCPKCGAGVPADAPEGLCPRCLGALNLETETVMSGAEAVPWTPPPASELTPLFPQLELLELIGRGGMGAVYKARQKELDRIVALKILPPSIGSQPAFAERFAREAKALAKLSHPGIVTIFDFGRADGLYFFLMEFVDGVSLRRLLAGGRVAAREALAIVPQICDALQYAHDQGIVHRDIKPENILLDRRGQVKVADFGLAKLVGTAEEPPLGGGAAVDSPTLTEADKIMGTPHYMAPEQRDRPQAVDHRADIYALGVVFYQMLTGELPSKPLQPPSRKVRIDVRLDQVVLQALEREPERRYQSASQIKTAVETLLPEPSFRNPAPGKRSTLEQELAPEVVPVKGWLRLAGVILVVVCCAGLVISIFLAANATAEKRRRTQCQVNLRQIGTALQLYAQDYGGRLPDCTPNNPNFHGSVWPWDVHTNLVAELEQRGALRKFLYCPSNPGMNDDRHWNFPQYSQGQTRVLGYAFLFPGCRDVPPELWRFDLKGDGIRKPEEVELAADATVSQEWDYSQIKGLWVDRTSHLRRGRPAGGNVLFEDGHASWRPFEKMKHQIVGQLVWDF